MSIVYSLPVHESTDVIVDTINNINKYSPENFIVLHINPSFTQFSSQDFAHFDNVFINPNQISFEWGGSLLEILDSNFIFAKSLNLNFDYYCLFSSNQMFVAHGFNEHIKKFRAGIQALPTKSYYKQMLISDSKFNTFMKTNQLSKIVKGHWEGSFYTTDLFQNISDKFDVFRDDNHVDLHLEEFIYPMIIQSLCNKEEIASPACYMEIGTHPALSSVSEKLINFIRNRSDELVLSGRIAASKIENIKRFLSRDTKIYNNVQQLYMVKRIDRDINDPLRIFINNLN